MSKTPLRLLMSAFAMLLALPHSQSVLARQRENIVVLEHADSLVGREIGGESVRELIGHVRFTQGKIAVRCDRAVQFTTSNRITMEGTVQVQDDSMRMVGSRGVYYSDTRMAEAFDRVLLEDHNTILRSGYGKYFANEKKAFFTTNVSVEDTASLLTSHELTYYRETQRLIADGDVAIFSRQNNLTSFGDHFEHDRILRYSKMTGAPRVIQVDTAGGVRDTLTITGIVLESYQDSLERLLVSDSVRILRNELAAEAGFSVFFLKRDSIILRKAPFIWYSSSTGDENQVSGDSMFITLQKRKLERVHVEGNARAISRVDTAYRNRFNQMTGQEIIMHFQKSKVDRIEVVRTATSLYYLFDRGRPNGLNKTTGDRVTMSFAGGKIDRISVVAGVEGQYVPERLVRGHEAEHNLTGFNWRADHPGKDQKSRPAPVPGKKDS